MKHSYYTFTTILFFSLLVNNLLAQNVDKPWSIEFGINAVDVYPVEEQIPQGILFDEFFNLTDHWNISLPYITVSRHLTNNFSLSVRGSYNKIKKWGQFGGTDVSVAVNDLKYYGFDGMLNYSLVNLTKAKKVEPYIAIGGGYTWIEEGPFNTFSNNKGIDNLVGAATLNGALGFKYWISDHIGLNLQTSYKHSFKEYLTKHWQHTFGIAYKFGKKEIIDTPKDKDNDGVNDVDDLCPDVSGLKIFNGCPDSDGDGFPDSKDKCPHVKGTENGCPKKEVTQMSPTEEKINTPKRDKTIINNKTIYFNYNSYTLDKKSRSILNEVTRLTKNSSSYNITIEGHTDDVGSDTFNSGLSLNRIKEVKHYLILKGVPSSSIKTSNYGESQPVSNNKNESNRALNRRVELKIKIVYL